MSTQAIASSTSAHRRSLFMLLFAGFVLTGVAITLAAPLLPVFIARWSLDDSQAGIFFAVQFAASLGGVWVSSLLTHYWGNRLALVFGYVLMSAGIAALNASTLAAALVAIAALGTGYGMVVPGTNLTVAEIAGPRSASLVSLVNLAWGIGAVACSPLVMLALKAHLLPQLLFALASLGCLLAFSLLFARFHEEKLAEANVAASPAGGVSVDLFTTVALTALFFIYVGTEVSLGGWAAAHAKRLVGGTVGMSTLAPMFFYGGLMTGRALAPLVLSRVREYRLVLGALLLVTAGTTLLVFATKQSVAFASIALAGLGCATVFPIYVAWLSRWYGARARRLSGLMFSMASIGGSAVPWLIGFISTHAGGLRVGLLVPLASALIMIFLVLLLRRKAPA